jgi:electron transfer flavoprotein beta subunit
MRVVVCCKAVPIDTKIESVQIVNGDIQFRDTEFYINEFDAYALDTALTLKKLCGAETIALTVGPLRAQEVLYIAIAKGIDRVLRIDGETIRPELIASGLIPVLQEIHPDLILAGAHSEDWMGGEVGIYLAQALNLGVAYAVIEICDLNSTHIRIKKEIGGGKLAEVRLKLPAVLCVQSGIQPLSYVSMIKRQKARNTLIKLGGELDRASVMQALSGMAGYGLKKVSVPSEKAHAVMIQGDRSEMVSKILDIIKNVI